MNKAKASRSKRGMNMAISIATIVSILSSGMGALKKT
jgi:hypothetical protein